MVRDDSDNDDHRDSLPRHKKKHLYTSPPPLTALQQTGSRLQKEDTAVCAGSWALTIDDADKNDHFELDMTRDFPSLCSKPRITPEVSRVC